MNSRWWAFAFAASIAVSASLWSFILVVLVATYRLTGEAAMGIGLAWYFSIPPIFIISGILGVRYNHYRSLETAYESSRWYILYVVFAGTAGFLAAPCLVSIASVIWP